MSDKLPEWPEKPTIQEHVRMLLVAALIWLCIALTSRTIEAIEAVL